MNPANLHAASRPGDGHRRRPGRRTRSALAGVALLSMVAAGACEPRFPLQYMRQAVAPGGYRAGGDTLSDPPGLTEDLPRPVNVGWDSIVARDTLRAVMTFNSTGYFIHRGEPMGYEYELLEAFAEAHELALNIQVARDRRLIFRLLNRGVGDVVAARLVATGEYDDIVRTTTPLYATRPVIVQRAAAEGDTAPAVRTPGDTAAGRSDAGDSTPLPGTGESFRVPLLAAGDSVQVGGQPLLDSAGNVRLRARLLTRPSELAGEQVFVPSASDYYSRIVELSDSLGESIELVEVDQAEQVEPLIQAVAEGRIQLTVSQENLAELSRSRFTNIIATPVVGPRSPVVWAVRSNAPELERELNAWLGSDEGEELRAILYRKYFVDRQGYVERQEDEFLASETGRISPYDSLLELHSKGIGWDWRLLAAQVAQESRFDPRARSWAGARGLLQLMPRTAREMGVTNPTDPADNVAGGVRYLAWLSDLWSDEVQDPEERRKFILASYNAGRGHVLDAQRLTEKHGGDPDSWEDVAYWLLQKSKPEVYRDPVVEHGYVRGLEPVQYVSKILKRYESYQGVR